MGKIVSKFDSDDKFMSRLTDVRQLTSDTVAAINEQMVSYINRAVSGYGGPSVQNGLIHLGKAAEHCRSLEVLLTDMGNAYAERAKLIEEDIAFIKQTQT